MQPGSLGVQEHESQLKAEGLQVLKLETPRRTGKEREADVLCTR